MDNNGYSRIGFGCLQLGCYGVGDINESEVIYSAHKAIEFGIKLFDTAPIYGLGHSETLLGKIIKDKRHDVIVATKCGLVWKGKGKSFRKHVDNSPHSIVNSVEASLRRLNTDYIDLLLLHYPDVLNYVDDSMNMLIKLKEQGKILDIGCCNLDRETLEHKLKFTNLTIQVEYNLINREIEQELLPYCQKHNITVMVHTPLARGLLSGKYDISTKFNNSDRRNRCIYFRDGNLKKNLKIVKAIKELSDKYAVSPSQIALKWILSNSSVSTVLVGIKNIAQLEDSIRCLYWDILDSDIKYLNEVSDVSIYNKKDSAETKQEQIIKIS